MDCDTVKEEHLAERYLQGELGESEVELFERHFYDCARCFDKLQVRRDLQAALVEESEEIRGLQQEPARRSGSPRVWALAAAVLVVAFGVWVLRAVFEGPPPSPPTAELSGPALMELARVDPPVFGKSILRGAEDEARTRFLEGMEHYAAGDYRAAVPYLREASALDPQFPAAPFYLGICNLMNDSTDSAVENLQRTVALGESIYLEEARYYLAKAHLRRADVPAAREELRKVLELRGDLEDEARNLDRALAELGERHR